LIGIDRYITHILVVPAGKHYKSLADLKGKKIGVSAPGSYSDNVIQYDLNYPDKFETLYDWRTIPHSGQAVVARQRRIDANPDAARGVARAVLRAEQRIRTDPSAVAKVAKRQFPDRGDAFGQQYAQAAQRLLSQDGHISHEGYSKMIEILQEGEPGLKPIDQSRIDLTDQLLGRGTQRE